MMDFNAIDKKETLAQKVAKTIKEAIITGDIKPGETLSTEPVLAEQFNVSRAVIRDAARMLMAWGLIDIRHGKGMYVTEEMNSYFLEAISTILRRQGTSTWEMQEYEQFIMPEVFAQATANCTESQKIEIEKRGQAYIDFIWAESENLSDQDGTAIQKELSLKFMDVIFKATNNRVLALMGQIQQVLREMRHISEDTGRKRELLSLEEKSIKMMIEAVKSGNSSYAKEIVSKIFRVGPKIEKIMREAPLGQIVTIPADIFFEEIGLKL
jgi:DNA-binding FadR family transcriptional regulator